MSTLRMDALIVSPSLSRLAADRRLLFAPTGHHVYRRRLHRSSSDVVVALLLLLLGGVELNPGPTTSDRSKPQALSLGVLNVCSARRKAVLIHDVINDHWLDALALTETWIPSSAPDAVKLDLCPPGYQVLHCHRDTSDQRGGGAALVYRDTIKATTVDIGNYTEFESLAVKLTGRRFKASAMVCVYRPPRTVTSNFTDQLSDILDQIMLLGNEFVVVGDFSVPGDFAGYLDPHAVDVFTQYGLRKYVTDPTHIGGNTLDLIVSKVAVQSVCFSNHHLLTCYLGVPCTAAASHDDIHTPTSLCARLTRQPLAPTFCSTNCSKAGARR